MRQVPGLPGTGPGTARPPAQTRGRKGRKEGREGKRREGAGLRRGKERVCGVDGWTEKRARGDRREGGLGLGSRQNQKREDNERVAWTAVVTVCFIDRTWWRIT